jgi:hypothetical protein
MFPFRLRLNEQEDSMNKKILVIGLLAAGMFSTAALALPNLAEADHYGRYDSGRYGRYAYYGRGDRRSDRSEWRRDQAELRRDQAELARDQADLRRMYRNGASRSEINRKKAEIRNDMREVREGERELSGSYSDVRRDRYDYGRSSNSPWWNWRNGWWYGR